VYLEWLCRLWSEARKLGEPRLLDADQIEAARIAFAGYGQAQD